MCQPFGGGMVPIGGQCGMGGFGGMGQQYGGGMGGYGMGGMPMGGGMGGMGSCVPNAMCSQGQCQCQPGFLPTGQYCTPINNLVQPQQNSFAQGRKSVQNP